MYSFKVSIVIIFNNTLNIFLLMVLSAWKYTLTRKTNHSDSLTGTDLRSTMRQANVYTMGVWLSYTETVAQWLNHHINEMICTGFTS